MNGIVKVMNRQFDYLGQIDDYTSLIMGKSYTGIGTFELHVDESNPFLKHLVKENIVFTEADRAYIILYREMSTEDGDIVIKGKELKSYLSRYLVFPPSGDSYYRVNKSAEENIKTYVQATLTRQGITQIEVAPNQSRGTRITYQSRYKNLASEIEALAKIAGLGWDIRLDLDRKKFIFDVVTSKNRSVTQSTENQVVFSVDFDNIENQTLIDSKLNYSNIAVVAGQGQGESRQIKIVGTASGLDAYELFVDARDLNNMSDLTARGNETLLENKEIMNMDNKVLTEANYVYKQDYNLGDIITVNNRKWNISTDLRIFELQEIHEEQGFKLEVSLGDPLPSPKDLTSQSTNSEMMEESITQRTMSDIIENIEDISVGSRLTTIGYYEKDDGGQATYLIETQELKWSIALGDGKFANIQEEDFVNYRMFGAELDGVNDDTERIKKCHLYADSKFLFDTNKCKVFTCDVRNHFGLIHIRESIYCSSNVDLSGSTIIVDDASASWFGSYVWGQNSGEFYTTMTNPEMRATMKEGAFRLEGTESLPPDTVLHMEETHYEIRDDDGYLYDVNKGELMVHRQGGIFSTALGSDWRDAGGTLVHAETEDQFLTTDLVLSYTYIPTQHRVFKGCNVHFKGSADNYCSVIWVKGHNCTVEDFTFSPQAGASSNTKFKNSMIYVWGSYKVTIRNCNGFNASGVISEEVPTPTSGYMVRAYQACDLNIEDCDTTGVWGSISVSSTKNCNINRTKANRIDVHDYIVNLNVDQCIVYHHSLQIGSGSGLIAIRDTVFYNQFIPEERYPSSHLIALQAGYGRVFSGKIVIDNVKYIMNPENTSKSFYFVKASFSPHSRSVEKSFKFPEITISDFFFDTIVPEDIFISALDLGGAVKQTTALTEPPVTNHVAFSGVTKWNYCTETKDYIDGDYLREGQVIRTFERVLNSAGKTAFHSIKYYRVMETGTYRIYPENDELPFSDLRELFAPYFLPGASYNTEENTDYVIARGSKFFPEYAFTGNIGSKTSGNYPTHKSGVEWVGDAEMMEGMYLRYDRSNVTIPEWHPDMVVSTNQFYTYDTKLFQVVRGGKTLSVPLDSAGWLVETNYGAARVKMVGSLWIPGIWLPEGGIALTYTRPGYNGADFTYEQYTAVRRDGRAIGDNLVPASGLLLDGGIIWRKTDQLVTTRWAPNTAYSVGDLVLINGVPHICAYVQTVQIPQRFTLHNISHTSNYKPYIFSFTEDMNVDTKGKLKVVVDSLDEYRGVSYNDRPFYGKSGNEQPDIVQVENKYLDNAVASLNQLVTELTTTISGLGQSIQGLTASMNDLTQRVEALELEGEVIYHAYTFTKGTNRWDLQRVGKGTNIEIGRLDIMNNNAFDVNYVIYESYGHGDFTWTQLKSVRLLPGEKATEYVQLSGTRNDFVVQTRSDSAAIDAPDSVLTLTFTNISNKQTPTLICP